MRTVLQDLRYGLRVMRKWPGFAAAAVLTLGLSIGINTAVFSVVYAALVRPLPFADPERLVVAAAENKRGGPAEVRGVAPADFVDWREQARSFDGLAAFTGGGLTLAEGEAPELISGVRVSDDFFRVMGVAPALGRAPDAAEFGSGAGRVVVLSHRLWQRRFGGDRGVLGRQLPLVGGASATVVGVMPEEFKFPSYAEVWSPLPRESGELRQRMSRYFTVVGRIKEGATREQAQEDLSGVAARLAEAHPRSNADWGVRLIPLRETLVGKSARSALLVLLGAVALVLLVACANVANLLLARSTARHKEMAIRAALGATRWRVVRQLLAEGVLLAAAGGALGAVLALWGVDALLALVPEDLRFARLDEARVDGAVLAFTAGVSLLTGLVVGLLPGLKVSRPELNLALKEAGRGASAEGRVRRARGLLVVAEIAVTLVLLVGAGLLVKSFVRLQQTDLGFEPRNLLTLGVGAPQQLYGQTEQRAAYFKQMQERLSALPGARAVAVTSSLPLDWVLNFSYGVEGRPARPGDEPQADYMAVSPNYFETMRIPVLKGRGFTERDATGAPDVAVINETMARRVFPGEDPLGRRITIDYMERRLALEVVGVVADVRQTAGEETGLQIYDCYLQRPWLSSSFVIRADGDPALLAASAQKAVREVDAARAASNVKTMEQLLSESVARPRFYTQLLTLFAAVALLLAAVGVYGVMSYTVTQRTHEIGIRIALGARGRDVIRLVVGQGMALALAGVTAGLAGAFALTRVMESLLYGVSATDAATFAGVALLLGAVALLACYLPARRATKVDPIVALRNE
ncbi:MAG TPA: ABC transporter permease [Pyrinomonadaceae bacterium]|jgi:putative ABC transport system permease protein|nr:ABC transporter permease [Pyrinomonadaceae bacterium]